MSRLTRGMDSNMVRPGVSLNQSTNLKYLFRQMETLFREVLNLKLEVRLTIVARDMKWLNRGVGVFNIGRLMSMFIMNKRYWARFNNFFLLEHGQPQNLYFIIHVPPVPVHSKKAIYKNSENSYYFSYTLYMSK